MRHFHSQSSYLSTSDCYIVNIGEKKILHPTRKLLWILEYALKRSAENGKFKKLEIDRYSMRNMFLNVGSCILYGEYLQKKNMAYLHFQDMKNIFSLLYST